MALESTAWSARCRAMVQISRSKAKSAFPTHSTWLSIQSTAIIIVALSGERRVGSVSRSIRKSRLPGRPARSGAALFTSYRLSRLACEASRCRLRERLRFGCDRLQVLDNGQRHRVGWTILNVIVHPTFIGPRTTHFRYHPLKGCRARVAERLLKARPNSVGFFRFARCLPIATRHLLIRGLICVKNPSPFGESRLAHAPRLRKSTASIPRRGRHECHFHITARVAIRLRYCPERATYFDGRQGRYPEPSRKPT